MPHTKKKEKISNFREIEYLSHCDHPNIVRFSRAYCFREEIWVSIILIVNNDEPNGLCVSYDFHDLNAYMS